MSFISYYNAKSGVGYKYEINGYLTHANSLVFLAVVSTTIRTIFLLKLTQSSFPVYAQPWSYDFRIPTSILHLYFPKNSHLHLHIHLRLTIPSASPSQASTSTSHTSTLPMIPPHNSLVPASTCHPDTTICNQSIPKTIVQELFSASRSHLFLWLKIITIISKLYT